MTTRSARHLGLLLALVTLLAGCPDEPGHDTTVLRFRVPRGEASPDYFALPWPSDVRRDPDGTVSLAGFPAPNALTAGYVATFDAVVKGWGMSSAVYFAVAGAIDPATLPATPADSLGTAATAYVVDVQAGSRTYGQRTPVRVAWKPFPGPYLPHPHVALLPEPGFPLRPATTYAAVITRGVRDAAGEPLAADDDFPAVMGDAVLADPALEAARGAFAPLRAYLDDVGISRQALTVATVFTTADPLPELVRLREAVYADLPAPPAAPADLAYLEAGTGYHAYSGTFEGPIYQHGNPPYSGSGGDIRFDAAGRPSLARTEPIRFAVSVPDAEMPAAGYPVILYSHGTGGDYRSHLDEGLGADVAFINDGGPVIARAAMIGIDQVLHGARCAGACNPELNFFNFQNPLAGRDNVRQGAIDHVQLLRLVETMDVASAPGTGQTLRFDPDRIYFMGHSQGGLVGPPFLAVEPKVKAAVLSGAGGDLILSLLLKTEPVDIPGLVAVLLDEDTLDAFHPVLNLFQTFIEPADPVNYAARLFRDPDLEIPPKHVYFSQGWVDSYCPPRVTEALGVAADAALVGPLLEPQEAFALAGQVEPAARPVGGNRLGGALTAVFLQYEAVDGDGHFVVFRNPQANRDFRVFLGTAIRDGIPSIPEAQ
jgi:hypothetical protein